MRRILGIDYGSKTIGVAVSDSLQIAANPLSSITRKDGGIKKPLLQIKELCAMEDICKIVVGLPKNMNNTMGRQAEETVEFAKRLEKETGIPAVMWDERLSSSQAERAMLKAGLSRKKRKGRIDSAAATIILQSYLDCIAYAKEPVMDDNAYSGGSIMDDKKNYEESKVPEGIIEQESAEEEMELEVITLTDDETGEEIDVVIIDDITVKNVTYLLVIPMEEFDDEMPNAIIVKELSEDGDDVVYEVVEEDEEFEEISKYFTHHEPETY